MSFNDFLFFLMGAWAMACFVDGLLYYYVVMMTGPKRNYWPLSGFLLMHRLMHRLMKRFLTSA